MKWGNFVITKIDRDANDVITQLSGKLDLEDKNYKGTKKLSWLAANEDILMEV